MIPKDKLFINREGRNYQEIFSSKKIKVKEYFRQRKTLEQIYGEEKAAEIRKKSIKWTKERIITSIKKIFEEDGPCQKKDLKRYCKEKRFCSETMIYKFWKNLDEMAKENNIVFSKDRAPYNGYRKRHKIKTPESIRPKRVK